MAAIKDEAVCIRLMDWSETSQIAVLFTCEHGKLSAVAKGAKRQQPAVLAKFSGGLELLAAGEAVFIVKRSAELAQLTEWDLHDPHWHLRRDWSAYRLAMYAADLVHHIVQDHDPHPRTYAALRTLLGDLREPAGRQAALLAFQWTVIDDLGLRPVLDRDAQTGAAIEGAARTVAFSAQAGGVVADTGGRDRWRVRPATIRLLQQFAAGQPVAELDGESLIRANRLLCAYFRAILDKQLPTMDAVLT